MNMGVASYRPLRATTHGQASVPAKAPATRRSKRNGLFDLHKKAGNKAVNRMVGGGSSVPLDPQVRAKMEARFGQDLSDVRITTGFPADDAARSLQARAFTIGSDIVFRDGLYSPHSTEGRRLLAHELAHVVQQKNALPTESPAVSSPGSPLELEAHGESERITSGQPAGRLSGASIQGVQREEAQVTSLGVLDNSMADKVGTAVFGSERIWEFFREIIRGAVGEARAESKAGGKMGQVRSRFRSLLFHPKDIGRLALGFLVGFVKGMVSPVTDLWHLIKGVVELNYKVNKWIIDQGINFLKNYGELKLRSKALKEKLDALILEASLTFEKFLMNPHAAFQDIKKLIDNIIAQAKGKAREAGKSAVQAVLNFFQLPWYDYGEKVGYFEGMVVVQVLLIMFSEGIGNALSAAGRAFAAIGRVGAEVMGAAFRWLGKAINWVVRLFRSFGETIFSFFKGLATKFAEVFEEIGTLMRSFAEGLQPALGASTKGKVLPGAKHSLAKSTLEKTPLPKKYTSFKQIKLDDIPAGAREKYHQRWEIYRQDPDRAFKSETDYIRFRWGHDENLLPPSKSATPKAFQLEQSAGRVAEEFWSSISGDIHNTKEFTTKFGKVEPDFIPPKAKFRNVVNGKVLPAKNPEEALFIADSKILTKEIAAGRTAKSVGLTDQIRGMIELAKKTESKILVLIGQEGISITKPLQKYGIEQGVKIFVKPMVTPSGVIIKG